MRPFKRPGRWPLWAAIACLALTARSAQAAPPWWRVSDGHAEVWVFAAPRVAPTGMSWDSHPLEERLKGASRLIIDPQSRGGLKAFGAFLGAAGSLRSSGPMEASLNPATRRQLAAVVASLHKEPGHYSGWKPVVAGTQIQNDFLKANDLKAGTVDIEVRRLARRAGVTERPAGAFDIGPMISASSALPPAAQDTCLSAILHTVELGAGRLRQIAENWARGEVRPEPLDPADRACLAAFPAIRALSETNRTEDVAAVAAALKSPGRTVAVFELAALTMPETGILARLRARGFTVTGPGP